MSEGQAADIVLGPLLPESRISSSAQTDGVTAIMIPILQMRELRLNTDKQLAHGHTERLRTMQRSLPPSDRLPILLSKTSGQF